MSRRRVVITGLGAMCGLGHDAPSIWAGAKAGRSSARKLTRIDETDLGSRIACEIRDFDAEKVLGHGAKKLDLFCQYGVVAADEALRDSGIDPAREDLDRCGVITGSGIGGLTELESQHTVLMERGARRVSP